LFLDDTIDFLEEMPSNIVKRVLKNADETTRKLINQFLNYPEKLGREHNDHRVCRLEKGNDGKTGFAAYQGDRIDKETIDTCYILDDSRKLEGVISIRKLILSDESVVIKDIMDADVIYVNTHDKQEEIAALFKKI